MYAYAANNPVRYIDPDGRAEKIPVPLTGRIGTLAHNTAYPIVDAAIYEQTGVMPIHNKGMFTADGTSKINRKRPDWQQPTGTTLLIWEMKPGHDVSLAQKDVSLYIALANAKGVDAEAGPSLGTIVEGEPITGLKNIYMDIYSPIPGIVLYNAYTIKPDAVPVPMTDEQKESAKNFAKSAGIAVGGGVCIYFAWKIAKIMAASVFAPPLIPAAIIMP